MRDVGGEGKDVGDLGIVLRRVRGWWTVQTESVPGLEGRAETETAFGQPPEPGVSRMKQEEFAVLTGIGEGVFIGLSTTERRIVGDWRMAGGLPNCIVTISDGHRRRIFIFTLILRRLYFDA